MMEQISNNDDNSSVRERIRKFNMLGKTNGSLSIPIKIKNDTHSSSSISSTSGSTMSEYGLSPNEFEQQKKLSNERFIIPKMTIETINLQHNTHQKRSLILSKSHINNENIQSISVSNYASPAIYKELQVPTNDNESNSIHNNSHDIGLEVIKFEETQEQIIDNDQTHDSVQRSQSVIEDYEENDIEQQPKNLYPPIPPPRPPPPLPSMSPLTPSQEELNYQPKRSLPLSNFLLEIGALVLIFIVCMVLVLAIRGDQKNLRIAMQIIYTYIYVVSIIWMIWCTFDIIKFRRQWMKVTSSANEQEDYMDIVERYSHNISYFLDVHNTGGLFMRVGAGLLCMGSILLTVIELGKTIEMLRTCPKDCESLLIDYSRSIYATKSITFIFRFVFHCVQFTFLFRYGNIVINRYHFIAKIGLIHIIIANFCTWFEAIVTETLEELHRHSNSETSTNLPITINTTQTITTKSVQTATISHISFDMINILKEISAATSSKESSSDTSNDTTTSALEFMEKIGSSMSVYLYPFLIEYSLISITVFYIMWRNVGKTENRSFLHFGDRHIFTVNCSRASHGLLIGGIILLLTILTLIPDYILEPLLAIQITHISEFILLFISLFIVCTTFYYTTKLYYDRQAHVDVFEQILILITTIGDFAYSFFGLFATILIESYTIKIPRVVGISIWILAIFQTFLQSAFILDALKRRSITKNDIRKKPGRELITALLVINLAIWMHDSLSAKKVRLNPIQNEYYNTGTWSIVQAFTSPLSIFYRFHSSVCLADIWQEVYHDHRNQHRKKNGLNHSINMNHIPNNQH